MYVHNIILTCVGGGVEASDVTRTPWIPDVDNSGGVVLSMRSTH